MKTYITKVPPAKIGKKQSGIVLLEALIAILIFSLGILALVALQAMSIKLTGDARYRASAALLAGNLFSEMRIQQLSQQLSAANLATQFQTDGTGYMIWRDNVRSALGNSMVDFDNCPPTVQFGPVPPDIVTVTILWRNTTAAAGGCHRYVATTQIPGV